MSSTYGQNIRFTIFGQSHSPAIGVTAEGLPYGFKPDLERLQAFLDRRAPGGSDLSTPRQEADRFTVLSGMKDGAFCGAPFTATIENTDTKSKDYSAFKDTPRPGHADYTAEMKYRGSQDFAGGGHFSGRLTAPLCLIGGICIQILEEEGFRIGSHIMQIADIKDEPFDPVYPPTYRFRELQEMTLPVMDLLAGVQMSEAIREARDEGDSLGGIIECCVYGLPAGLGDPMFDGMENRIASLVFGIPAVKGIEFGAGFRAAAMKGSEHNDDFSIRNEKIVTETNNAGGILGGISNGMPILFRAAIKPTPSIFKKQQSVSLSKMEPASLQIQGRHDPCIVPRALPCVEAAAAIAVYDALLESKKY